MRLLLLLLIIIIIIIIIIRASSPTLINIRISVPFMRDTTRARARKYGKDAGLSPSSTHVRQWSGCGN